VIFALPSLQLHFKTEHFQGPTTPDATQQKPVVECSFITEFEDHIFVTVDADAFFFLHDLITSYLKEKEKVINSQQSSHNTRSASPNTNVSTGSAASSSSNLNLEKNSGANLSNSSFVNDSNGSLNVISPVAGGSNKNLNAANSTSSLANQEDLRQSVANKKINKDKADKEKEKYNKMDLESFMKTDWRHFNCKTWHLEPTVR
jgi:hypothetical protein